MADDAEGKVASQRLIAADVLISQPKLTSVQPIHFEPHHPSDDLGHEFPTFNAFHPGET